VVERRVRHLVVVLGDQLDPDAAAFDGFDAERDMVWMAEVYEESTHVWSSKPRIAVFLAAMRHFAEALIVRGWNVRHVRLDDAGNTGTLAGELTAALSAFAPSRVIMTAPGDWRVWKALKSTTHGMGVAFDVRPDRHFYGTVQDFAGHVRGLKGRPLRLEYFYRGLRRRHGVLMTSDGQPEGGRWNYDDANRRSFGRAGPGLLPGRMRFEPDGTTREVLSLVARRFADHPGELDDFAWPVTRDDALRALSDFIDHRLPTFGTYQDAMWPGEPWLHHSQLSAALNLKLLNPREVVAAAEAAYRDGRAPLAGVEGFVRQILGWREYVRGVYWTQMPGYLERNALGATGDLPDWYWSGDTDFACLRETIRQTLRHGYAHHIQRLMVTGLFALLLGVRPRAVHEWYLAVYVDAVEWVELPNTLGMSQFADAGLMGSKPYLATGRYIERMGGPCATCRYDPGRADGDTACPFTTLYWDFLLRHRPMLSGQARTVHQLQRLDTLDDAQRHRIARRAADIRDGRVGRTALAPP
jgi:deoxyribodipyrimidine photolyase-related protein